MAGKLKFETKTHPMTGATVLIAFGKRKVTRYTGETFHQHVGLRVAKELPGWRVEFAGLIAGAWMPWELITEEAFPTAAAAKKAAQAFATA